MTLLFTSGYQGETLREFINKILKEDIDIAVDIRENPFSRKPGFSMKPLSASLRKSGVEYYHFQELGTPAPLRHYLADKRDYNSFFEQYKNFLPEFKDSLDDLVDIGKNKKICLLCFEKDPHFCHRKVVADFLVDYLGKKVKLIHL